MSFQYGLKEEEELNSAINEIWEESATHRKSQVLKGTAQVKMEDQVLLSSYQAWRFDLPFPDSVGILVFFGTQKVKVSEIDDHIINPWLEFLKNNLENYLSKNLENETAVLKAILDNTSELIVLMDPNHRVLEFNQFAQKLLLEYFEEPIKRGSDYRKFVLDHIQELYHRGFQKAIGGEPFFVEHHTVSGDASHWFEYYMFPIYNLLGDLVGVCLRGKDITAEKIAELELRDLAETFNALNENLNESVIILSKDYGLLRFNSYARDRFFSTIGKKLESGIDFRTILFPGFKEVFIENFERAREGNLIEIDYKITANQRFEQWIKCRFIPIFSDHQKILGIGLLIRNIHDQKILQLELEESEEKFRKIVSSAAMSIVIVDESMLITTVNPELTKIFGYGEDELVGQNIHLLIPARFHKAHLRHEKDYSKAPRPMRMAENRIIKAQKKSGEEIDVEVSLNSFQLGDRIFYMAMILDVTERNKLARLLEDATSLSLTGNWEYSKNSLDQEHLYWSSMTREIFEVPQDYVPVFSDLIRFFESESFELLQRHVAILIETGERYDLELVAVTWDGKKKWVRAIGTNGQANDSGIKIYGSIQDIHQKKINELELIKSLQSIENYKKALESSSYVHVTNLEGIITDVNDSWCERTGYSREELIGQHSDITKSDHQSKEFFEHLWNTIRSGKIWKGEIKDVSKTGEYFWVETTIVPMKNEKGEIYQYITIRNDISEKKKAMEELEIRAKELARSNAELEQFAYVASHDLQEPLRMVTSFLTQLKRKYADQLDETGNKYIDFAVEGGHRMRSTILDLLEFSRVGKGWEEKEEINLHRIIDTVISQNRKLIEDSHAQILVEDMPVILSYSAQILLIFGNLINNAIKYRKANQEPIIKIAAEDQETHWLFSVSDNGIGFNMEYAEKIFVIFQRLHTQSEYQGNGIGLAIVRKIIENLKGKIWVESKENVGTTFYFTLPK